MPPRNLKAFDDGQAVRAAVKAIMAARSPLLPSLTAKVINARLPVDLQRDENTIRWHMRQIRREAELALAS
jgi:hypothetical protein